MAAKTKTKTKTKANQVKRGTHKPKHTSWHEELGIGYATYENEENYVSPTIIDEEQSLAIGSLKKRLATAPIFVEDNP